MGELFVVFFQAPDIAGAVGQFVGSAATGGLRPRWDDLRWSHVAMRR